MWFCWYCFCVDFDVDSYFVDENVVVTACVFTRKDSSYSYSGLKIGKCPGDQVFLLRSCITHAKYLHQALYLNFYDFRQCFDKLWLEDSIVSLYKLGLDNELLASIYETNYAATITVNTPLGKSGSFPKLLLSKDQ